MRRSIRRASLCVIVAMIVAGVAASAWASIDFGEVRRIGPPSTWSDGNALAQTNGYLETVWASDCPPPHGACAADDGPYMGVFFQRAKLGAGAPPWNKPERISQAKQHAARPTISAEGDAVVVGWVTRASYRHDSPRKPRVFYVRRSVRQGSRWGPAVRLSRMRGRVDFPRLAASGGVVYAVWTNADSGEIRLASSVDRGATWGFQTIGATTAGSSSAAGYRGDPTIGASGSNVVVSWYADDAGRQVAKVSSAGASDLATAAEIPISGPSPNDGLHAADAGGADDGSSHDVVIAYTTATGIAVRTYDGSSLGDERAILDPWVQSVRGFDYDGAYGPAVQPYGAGGIAVAFAGCRRVAGLPDDCRPSADARIDLLYAESADGGHSWPALQRLADSEGAARLNDEPSLALVGGKRFVAFDAWNSAYTAYNVALRVGSGTP
jgi:hypothetical protein